MPWNAGPDAMLLRNDVKIFIKVQLAGELWPRMNPNQSSTEFHWRVRFVWSRMNPDQMFPIDEF
jgi:hypothetical protein